MTRSLRAKRSKSAAVSPSGANTFCTNAGNGTDWPLRPSEREQFRRRFRRRLVGDINAQGFAFLGEHQAEINLLLQVLVLDVRVAVRPFMVVEPVKQVKIVPGVDVILLGDFVAVKHAVGAVPPTPPLREAGAMFQPINEIIVRPAMTHHSHFECLRIVPIIVKKWNCQLNQPAETWQTQIRRRKFAPKRRARNLQPVWRELSNRV